MLDDIRERLQQAIDTVPAGELRDSWTTLDELHRQLHRTAGTSTNEEVHQALQLFGIAAEKAGEAAQAATQAAEHTRLRTTVY
ncbi:hypothetical protein [Actinopolyspora halophila]|uniref:hypothetical protein n=1 Tax=Actinopolyspora halophila TaxID=1850 RepID=UPI00036451AD|nr:hypothetical protein [Actinopolyspora halophila]